MQVCVTLPGLVRKRTGRQSGRGDLVESWDGASRGTGLVYAEDRSALNWPLMWVGLLSSVAGALAVAACLWWALALAQPGALFLAEFPALWSFVWIWQLWSNWPTGIRIDTAGIQIGAVRDGRQDPQVPRTVRSVLSQRHEVFACPWAAVRGIAVTDRAGLRGLREREPSAHARRRPSRIAYRVGYYNVAGWPGNTPTLRPRTAGIRLGWLSAPLMRAALVIYVAPGGARFPQLESVNGWPYRSEYPVVGLRSRVWLVPTRHPEALRAALAQVPGCPPVAPYAVPDRDWRATSRADDDAGYPRAWP
jgi:hypothetical protein